MKKFIAVLVSSALINSGCSLMNPHVRAPEIDRSLSDTANSSGIKFAGDLPNAIDDAGAQVRAYVAAAADHSRFRNWSVLALVPLTATILYKGITADSGISKNVTALGLGAGSLYFGGSLFYSETRQHVYLEGARALECSVTASRPYLIAEEDYKQFKIGTDAINAAIPRVTMAMQKLQSTNDTGPEIADWNKRIATELRQARRLVSRAGEAVRLSKQYQSNVDHAGFDLRQKVKTIVLKVSDEVIKTEPNFSALAGLNAGITGALGKFTSIPSAESPTSATPLATADSKGTKGSDGSQQNFRKKQSKAQIAKAEAEAAALKQAIAIKKIDLQRALDDLSAATAQLADKVNSHYSFLKGLAELKKTTAEVVKPCDTAATQSTFRVIPDDTEITLTPGANSHYSVLGSTGLPRLSLVGPGAGRLERKTTEDGQFVVTAKNDADSAGAAGEDAQLVFSDDTTSNQKTVHVILGKPQAKPVPDKAESSSTPQTQSQADPKIACLQVKGGLTGADIDGKLGPTTIGVMKKLQVKYGLPESDRVSNELLKAAGCG